MRSIADALLARAGDTNPGLRFDDLEWSWGEVVDDALRRAALWTELRQPGPPHVAVLLDNVPEHVWWLGACALSGSVVVGANPTHRGEALAEELAHTRCQLLVTDRRYLGLVEGLGPRPGHRGRLDGQSSCRGGGLRPASRRAGARHTRRRRHRRRSARLSHFHIWHNGEAKGMSVHPGPDAVHRCRARRAVRTGAGDCCYLSMPLFHSNALMAGWAPALVGGSTMALPTGGRFSASGFLPDVRRHGVTYCNYVGRPLSYVLATPEQPDDADNPLRFVFGNEAAPGDVERFARRFGCDVSDNYGSTEGGVAVSRTPDTPDGALGPAPPDTRVVAENGQECAVAVFDERRSSRQCGRGNRRTGGHERIPLLRGVLGERRG